MTDKEFLVCAGSGIMGSCLTLLFGNLSGVFVALIILMVLDYITGVVNGIKEKKLSSEISFWGLVKKTIILIIVIVGNAVDTWVFKGGNVRGVVICFYIANEAMSIIENSAKLGVPVPKKLKEVLAQLKEEDDG